MNLSPRWMVPRKHYYETSRLIESKVLRSSLIIIHSKNRRISEDDADKKAIQNNHKTIGVDV